MRRGVTRRHTVAAYVPRVHEMMTRAPVKPMNLVERSAPTRGSEKMRRGKDRQRMMMIVKDAATTGAKKPEMPRTGAVMIETPARRNVGPVQEAMVQDPIGNVGDHPQRTVRDEGLGPTLPPRVVAAAATVKAIVIHGGSHQNVAGRTLLAMILVETHKERGVL